MVLAPLLPTPFKLALFNPSMAESFHEEQKTIQYKAMRAAFSSKNRAAQLHFPSLAKLQEESKQQIRAAVLKCDKELNQEQTEVIQNILYGWQTKERPNNAIHLNFCSSDVKEYLRKLGTVSQTDLKWWEARSCFVQGPPGTGKTRMLAALIAVILEHVEQPIRILVVCETNKALDDIFTDVLRLFKRRGARDRVARAMVRIGYSNVKCVQDRQVHH